MTSTKKFGGHGQIWMNGWPMMIPYNSKILPTWTRGTKGALGPYIETQRFPFNHGFVLILMIFLFLGCRWGEWNSCPFHYRDLDTYIVASYVPIQSQRAYFYGCQVWYQQCEVPFIHIDDIWFSLHMGVSCLGYHKLTNMWRLGGVVECHVGKASLAYAKLETILFHYGWCPTLFYVLVVCQHGDSITYLLFMVRAMVSTLMLGVPWQDCVGSKSYPNFSLCMTCVESMTLMFHGKIQGFKGQMCNIWSPPHGDVHVHQPRWDHWWFQGT